MRQWHLSLVPSKKILSATCTRTRTHGTFDWLINIVWYTVYDIFIFNVNVLGPFRRLQNRSEWGQVSAVSFSILDLNKNILNLQRGNDFFVPFIFLHRSRKTYNSILEADKFFFIPLPLLKVDVGEEPSLERGGRADSCPNVAIMMSTLSAVIPVYVRHCYTTERGVS